MGNIAKSTYLFMKFPKLLSSSLLFFNRKSSQLNVLSCNREEVRAIFRVEPTERSPDILFCYFHLSLRSDVQQVESEDIRWDASLFCIVAEHTNSSAFRKLRVLVIQVFWKKLKGISLSSRQSRCFSSSNKYVQYAYWPRGHVLSSCGSLCWRGGSNPEGAAGRIFHNDNNDDSHSDDTYTTPAPCPGFQPLPA